MLKIILSWTLILFVQLSISQRTVGVIQILEGTYDGLMLLSPITSKETFLIDNCGFIINKWSASQVPGQTSYLLENGDLLRTARVPGFFTGGGVGGKVEIYSWEGDLKWKQEFATEFFHQHHIAHPMPNGNILVVLWYKYSREEAIAKGFNPNKLTNQGIWSDRIIEVKPLANDSMEIVWQWDFWDHTIQDLDSTKTEYGVVKDHPELLDVNFYEDPGANIAEWIHLNSLDYHPELDQILVSSKYHNEFYIIDHSTSIQEAKSHSGGKYGKGGDFLYRWGNPRSYRRGSIEDHYLFGQHDVEWIDKGIPGADHVLLYNNGSNRPGELYSTVEEFVLPINADGTYNILPNRAFGPMQSNWKYQDINKASFYSSRVSGAQRLPNGNTIICEGNKGRLFEINPSGKLLWNYINPANNFGTTIQGDNPINNDVFNITKYSKNYKAFIGRTLIPAETVETNIEANHCTSLSRLDDPIDQRVRIYPNPVSNELNIDMDYFSEIDYVVNDIVGKVFLSGSLTSDQKIVTKMLPLGMYYLTIRSENSQKILRFAFVKH